MPRARRAYVRTGGDRRRGPVTEPPDRRWLLSPQRIKAVADLLGHSSISITGDIYGHTSDDTARAAVDGWIGALGL